MAVAARSRGPLRFQATANPMARRIGDRGLRQIPPADADLPFVDRYLDHHPAAGRLDCPTVWPHGGDVGAADVARQQYGAAADSPRPQ